MVTFSFCRTLFPKRGQKGVFRNRIFRVNDIHRESFRFVISLLTACSSKLFCKYTIKTSFSFVCTYLWENKYPNLITGSAVIHKITFYILQEFILENSQVPNSLKVTVRKHHKIINRKRFEKERERKRKKKLYFSSFQLFFSIRSHLRKYIFSIEFALLFVLGLENFLQTEGRGVTCIIFSRTRRRRRRRIERQPAQFPFQQAVYNTSRIMCKILEISRLRNFPRPQRPPIERNVRSPFANPSSPLPFLLPLLAQLEISSSTVILVNSRFIDPLFLVIYEFDIDRHIIFKISQNSIRVFFAPFPCQCDSDGINMLPICG